MFKSIDKWLLGYLEARLRRPRFPDGIRHLFFCVADHFEPFRGTNDRAVALGLANAWAAAYPGSVRGFHDADGQPPRHTFFYPQEEYDAAVLDTLAGLCRDGLGEVEIHLHHRHDTPDALREKLTTFRDVLHKQHGLLGREQGGGRTVDGGGGKVDGGGWTGDGGRGRVDGGQWTVEGGRGTVDGGRQRDDGRGARDAAQDGDGAIRYGFIHGNWALCNSRPDGDWCGVNEELGILAGTGCYADFTFPSAPSPTQARMVNAIYRATDNPGQPRGADRGVRVVVQERPKTEDRRPETADGGDAGTANVEHPTSNTQHPTSNTQHPTPNIQRPTSSVQAGRLPPSTVHPPPPLMIVQGPLALNWRARKWGLLPRLENAEITGVNPPTRDRLSLWVDSRIGVGGRPDWVFVKVHTHGCVPANRDAVLGPAMRDLHGTLQREYNDGRTWQLHYVTARELYNLVRAAEAGWPGAPGAARDWQVGPPPVCGRPKRNAVSARVYRGSRPDAPVSLRRTGNRKSTLTIAWERP